MTEKKYIANFTQSGSGGSDAPVATIFKNSIGAIALARTGTGVYTLTKTGAFAAATTTFTIAPVENKDVSIERTNDNVLTIHTYGLSTGAWAAADSILLGTKVEIVTYEA